jgi:hypothetical protein
VRVHLDVSQHKRGPGGVVGEDEGRPAVRLVIGAHRHVDLDARILEAPDRRLLTGYAQQPLSPTPTVVKSQCHGAAGEKPGIVRDRVVPGEAFERERAQPVGGRDAIEVEDKSAAIIEAAILKIAVDLRGEMWANPRLAFIVAELARLRVNDVARLFSLVGRSSCR